MYRVITAQEGETREMGNTDLELTIRRSDGAYVADAYLTHPDSPTRTELATGALVLLSEQELQAASLDSGEYGRRLTWMLFADNRLKVAWQTACTTAHTTQTVLRVQVCLDPTAADLYNLHWEYVNNPQTGAPLCTSEHVLFVYPQAHADQPSALPPPPTPQTTGNSAVGHDNHGQSIGVNIGTATTNIHLSPPSAPWPSVWWERFRHHPRIFYPTMIVVIIAAIVCLLAALSGGLADSGGARAQVDTWTQHWFVEEEAEDETLIVIVPFYVTEGNRDTDAHNEIRRAIEAQAENLEMDNLRLELSPDPIEADDRDAAKALGNRYDASMVIWGADTGVRVTVVFFNRRSHFAAGEVQIDETQHTQVAQPDAYATFITTDLPAQLSFLALFGAGQSAMIEHNYDEALLIVEQAIKMLPPDPLNLEGVAEAYFLLGWLYQETGKPHQDAIDAYTQAISLNPSDTNAYINRGNAYRATGDFEHAIADYTAVVASDQQNIKAYINRGNTYARQGHIAQAFADFHTAIRIAPDDGSGYNNMCWWGSLAGRAADGEVIDACEQAVARDPDNGALRDSRGLNRAITGDYAGAVEDFKAYLTWVQDLNIEDAEIMQRRTWIVTLEKGENPFDAATREALRTE